MPSAQPLVLVSGADDAYALPLAVTLYSALTHLSRDAGVEVHVIDGGISADNRRELERTVARARMEVSIRWYVPDPSALDGLWVGGHFTAAAYCRVMVSEAVPDEADKAIYLDSDVLVEADLGELWQEPMEDRMLLAAQDFLIPYLSWPGAPAPVRGHSGSDCPYFNSGVLVMNVARWRREGVARRVFAYLRQQGKELTFPDQEALNAVLAGEVGLLHPKWNVQTSLLWLERWPESSFKQRMRSLRDELVRCPGIWHFIGPSKPWHGGFSHPVGDRWHGTREAAGWPAPEDTHGNDLAAWLERQRRDDEEIASVVPSGDSFVLVGEDCRLPLSVRGRRALPFLERDGMYRGNPEDDDTAILELERMRTEGARFVVFDRTALWWLDHYTALARHLRSSHRCLRESDRLAVFELQAPHA